MKKRLSSHRIREGFVLDSQDVHCEKPGVAVFYSEPSLRNQLTAWLERHGGVGFELSSAKSLSGIRRALGDVELAIIDATEDIEQVAAAFQLSVAKLGGYSVAVYTEEKHELFELFVRQHGAILLLGPLELDHWNEVFEYLRNTALPRLRVRTAADPIDREFVRSAEVGLCDNDLIQFQNRRLAPAQPWSTKTPRRQAS